MYELLHGDCLDVMRGLPTGHAALTLTSPPYSNCRTYGIGYKLKGQGWVDWMAERVVEMCRVTAGLVFVNMAGKVEQFRYQPVVEWLVADLTRNHGLVCGPAPYVFHRVGIPGSGGPHYHRRDWEPVYAFARPECLPPKWSDNTVMGHPPKWAPGGAMSNRKPNGQRVNQWGMNIAKDGKPTATSRGGDGGGDNDGLRRPTPKPSHVVMPHDLEVKPSLFDGDAPPPAADRNEHGVSKAMTRRRQGSGKREAQGRRISRGSKDGDTQNSDSYHPPVKANPGNVIRCKVGGGLMGDKLAHESEAPFPESLVEFFVLSYAPPGGLVLDPFCGSGTVVKVAAVFGRRAIGIDVRDGKGGLDTARRRLELVTPAGLYAAAEAAVSDKEPL